MEDNIREKMHQYVDGELTGSDREAFEESLALDAQAAGRVAELEALALNARDLPVFKAPAVDLSSRQQRVFTTELPFRPFAAGAAAALVLVMLGFGLLRLTATAPSHPASSPVALRLVYFAPKARSVAVIGDFNNWSGEIPMAAKGGTGYWQVELSVNPGEYHYTLILDGNEQVTDPAADYVVDDDFGSRNSVVRVGI